MAQQEQDSSRLQQLIEAAHSDRHLKLRLLNEPLKVAKEWGVKLGEQEVERLSKLGAFVELANQARLGALFRSCDPRVCYPSTVWLRQELVELVRELIIFHPPWGPIFYPPHFDFGRLEEGIDRKLGTNRGRLGR
jgi:hypothetical protein